MLLQKTDFLEKRLNIQIWSKEKLWLTWWDPNRTGVPSGFLASLFLLSFKQCDEVERPQMDCSFLDTNFLILDTNFLIVSGYKWTISDCRCNHTRHLLSLAATRSIPFLFFLLWVSHRQDKLFFLSTHTFSGVNRKNSIFFWHFTVVFFFNVAGALVLQLPGCLLRVHIDGVQSISLKIYFF